MISASYYKKVHQMRVFSNRFLEDLKQLASILIA